MAISRMDMERQLRAGGGIMTMLEEEPRQGYFLGKIVKKAKKAVKKIVKSPIGKMALAGAGLYGLGALGAASGSGGFLNALRTGGMGNFGLSNLGGGLSRLAFGLKGGTGLAGQGLLGSGGAFSGKRALITGGALASALPFFMGGDEEVDEGTPVTMAQPMVEDIRNQAKAYYSDPTNSALYFMPPKSAVRSSFYAAEGGLASLPRGGYSEGESVLSKEQMAMIADMKNKGMDMSTIESMTGATAEQITNYLSSLNQKQEGGIMDLGGLEKDYREGGFVPLGEEERADDVPARLSKNEFVFTADAVRNAGGGDIDKGAEVMQNMMDNLEAGGTISEESQGMENPAQEMFDQSQLLESRIA